MLSSPRQLATTVVAGDEIRGRAGGVPSTNSLMCCCGCEERGRQHGFAQEHQRNRGGTPRHAVEMVEDGGRPRGWPWRRKEADVADRASGRRRLHAATARPQASTDRNHTDEVLPAGQSGRGCRKERPRITLPPLLGEPSVCSADKGVCNFGRVCHDPTNRVLVMSGF